MRQMRLLTVTLCLVTLSASAAFAGGRPDKNWKDWFGQVYGGYSLAQGDFGDVVDDDLLLGIGATYWPDDWAVGIAMDLTWDERDISSSTIRAINDALEGIGEDPSITGGDVRTWGFSVNAVWGLGNDGQGLYLTGGVGLDDIEGRLTEDGLVYYPPICDPYFWWCYPGGVGPGTIVVLEDSTTEFAWNAGVGFSFDLSSGSTIFVEARYKSADTSRETTETIPLVIGFRW